MSKLSVLVLWLAAASALPAQSRRPRPPIRQTSASDSLARLAAARAALAQLDSARQGADWATAGRYLCADMQSVPAHGPPIGRDSLLTLVARAHLRYGLAPVWEGALLSWSPNDSTVVFDGRAQPRGPGVGGQTTAGAVWVYREFRHRGDVWCQVLGRVRND